ncbi:MAG: AraC family transcriptional regulator [Anaerolineae bacterium]|nr:AraC family transcriptional regulator [Anaerolineae bacterium]
MPDISVIVQALDFVETHLCQPVSVAEMAEAVSYSLYYFCRIFHQMTYHTPYDYLMRRRIAEAARALLQSDRKIIDIAFDYQFNNPETFSRAFKRVIGVLPTQWRKQGKAALWQLMPRLTGAHLVHLERNAPWYPVIKILPAVTLVGIMTLIPDVAAMDKLKNAAWNWLCQELAAAGIMCSASAGVAGNFYGLTYYAPGAPVDSECTPVAGVVSNFYMAAVSSDSTLAGDHALVVKQLPALSCVCFRHRGPARDLKLTLDYIYYTWMPQSEHVPAHPWYLEHYEVAPSFQNTEDNTWFVYVPICSVQS